MKILSLVGRRICVLKSARNPYFTTSTAGLDLNSLNRKIIALSNDNDLVSAQELFDQMPQRDVVSWNSTMTAYARNECFKEVLLIFSVSRNSQIKPNHTSFSVVLTSCGKARDLTEGRQIHGLSIKIGSSTNVFVGTSLISMYSRCSETDCLIRAFEDIDFPNISSWNALISGFVLNRQVSNARKVFEEMPSRNAISWTAMISGYIKVKKMRIAISMFDIMPVKNHISWSVMLGGFIHCRLFGEAIEFFSKMLSHGVIATSHSIVNVVTACVILGNFKHGCKIHGYVEKLGFNFDYMIEASLVSMYCACLDVKEAELEFKKFNTKFIGSWNSLLRGFINSGTKHIDEARNVFDNMENKDYISWNSMISGYLKNNKLYDAIELFRKMPKPTVETFTALMFGFMEHGDLEEAEKLFIMMPQRDVVSYTALVFGYVENGKLDKAMELFRNMPERNVVSYNIMISGLLRHGRTREAYDLFKNCPEKDDVSWDSLVIGFVHNELYFEAIQLYREMVLLDLTPSELVIASLIRASVKLLKLIHGEQMHGATIKLGYQSCLIVGNSLVNMYGKFGNVYMAKLVFDQMTDCDVVTWNALIHSYACNGLGKEAIAAFEESKTMKIKPDDITFLGVLFACNHGFLWAEAQRYFNSMKSDYGIKPRLAHYSCLIDLLCRVGMAEKAEELVHSMPFVPDSIAWTSILSGSRLHCNVRLAELAANQISAWDPLDRMPYLHLINVYKSAGRWDDVVSTRSKMNELAYNERSGCSWIE